MKICLVLNIICLNNDQAWNLYEEDRLMDLVDPGLDASEYDVGELKRVLEVALMCTQASVTARPSMSQVVMMLVSRAVEMVQEPSRPMFVDAGTMLTEEERASPAADVSIASIQVSAR